MPPQLQAKSSLKKQGRVFHGRTKTACSFCRKKKVKCDGKVPCSTCLQYKNQQCDLISQVPNRRVQYSQILKPKLPIKNANNVLNSPAVSSNGMGLYAKVIGYHSETETLNKTSGQFADSPSASSEETINFFEDGGKIVAINPYSRQFFGPFSWLSLLLNDIYSLPYMRYILSHKKDFNTIIEDLETYTKDNHTFRDEILTNTNLSDQKSTNINEENNKSAYIHHAVQKNDLTQSIRLILPKKDVIWKLINQFFFAAYPFFPLVEESDFRRHLEEIIGEEDYSDTKVADFTIRKRVDYAVIGLLLIFLRIAYLSLSSNMEDDGPKNVQKSPIASEREYLLSNPIEIEAFTVAKNCFSQFDYFNCIDIQVLQLVLFIRIYYIYAPEEGDDYDGKISRILNSTIIQMAYSMGLHRDPGRLPYNFNNIKLNNNLNRKIWYFIVSLDYNSSILSGDPLSTKIIPADTSIPEISPDDENATNKTVENEIVEVLVDTKMRLAMSKTVIDIVLNIEQGANVKQLLLSLANLESLSQRDVVLANQFYEWDMIPLKQVIEMKNNLELRFWLSSIYFKLFIHYEERKNNDLICVYSKKILKISVVEIIPYILKVSDSHTKAFTEFDILYIMPSLLILSHKFIFTISFVLIRVKYFEFKLKLASEYESNILENDSRYKMTQHLIYLLQACVKWILDFLKRLSKRYYKAWRLYKVQNHILSIIASENFYLENKTSILNLWNPFSEQTIEKLIETLQPAVHDIEASNKVSLLLQDFSIGEEFKNQMDFMGNDALEFDSFWLDMISRNNPIDFESDYIFNPFASLDMALDPVPMSDLNNGANSMNDQK